MGITERPRSTEVYLIEVASCYDWSYKNVATKKHKRTCYALESCPFLSNVPLTVYSRKYVPKPTVIAV